MTRDEAVAALGQRYKPPVLPAQAVNPQQIVDVFTEAAKTNSGGKTKAAKVRAFTSVPDGWKPKADARLG